MRSRVAVVEKVARDFNEAAERVALEMQPDHAVTEEDWTPDCEWVPMISDVEQRVYRGYEGQRRYWRDLAEAFRELQVAMRDVVEVTGGAIAGFDVEVVARESGARLRYPAEIYYEFEGDRIRRGRQFRTREEALRAAGEVP